MAVSAIPPLARPGENLLDTTIRLLKHRDRTVTYELIAKEIDCSIGFLSSLVSDDPPTNPGVNSIQALYEFLANRELTF